MKRRAAPLRSGLAKSLVLPRRGRNALARWSDPVAQRSARDPRAASRQSRADRFLDLFMHQLPAFDPVRRGPGRPCAGVMALVVIGVHSPEFAFEKEPANVHRAVAGLRIKYRVAIDNDYSVWRAFQGPCLCRLVRLRIDQPAQGRRHQRGPDRGAAGRRPAPAPPSPPDVAEGDELYEVMRCAPSTRNFTDEPVAREVLERVLDNARYAPSGGNRQGWRVIVITDPDIRRRLRELYQEPWDAYMVKTGGRAALDAGEASGLPKGRLRMLRGADEYARRFDQVPVHLLLCVDVSALAITDEALDRPSIVGGASIYPFVQNILLGLRHEGLGAAFTTLLVPAEPAIRELLVDPGRDRDRRAHLGRPPRGPVAARSSAASRCRSSPTATATASPGSPARRQPTMTPTSPSAVSTTHRTR